MERLPVANVGTVRTELLNGREHWVVPMVHLAEGVLKGSQGALFYPDAEIAKHPGLWNGVLITKGHPTENGAPASARQPRIVEKYGLGYVYNDAYAKGKRSAEAWFDKEWTENKAPEVAAKLKAGVMVPVSTGVYTENDDRAPGEHNGEKYYAVARNYRPDHLAVLDGPGACDVPKCGLNVNSGNKLSRLVSWLASIYTSNEPSDAIDPDKACQILHDGSVRGNELTDQQRKMFAAACHSENELADNAWSDEARAAAAAARKHQQGQDAVTYAKGIARRREAVAATESAVAASTASVLKRSSDARGPAGMGHMVAKAALAGASGAHVTAAGYHEQLAGHHEKLAGTAGAGGFARQVGALHSKAAGLHKAAAVAHKTALANPVYNTVSNSEDTMTKVDAVKFLTANCECLKGQEQALNAMPEETLVGLVDNQKQQVLVVNALAEGVDVGGKKLKLEFKDGVLNAFPPKDDKEEEDAEEKGKKGKGAAENEATRNAELRKLLEADPIYVAAKEVVGNEQRRLAEALVANAPKEHKAKLLEKYSRMPLPELRELVALTGNSAAQPAAQVPQLLCNWFGAGGGPPAPIVNTADNAADVEAMTPPTLNYQEMVKKAG